MSAVLTAAINWLLCVLVTLKDMKMELMCVALQTMQAAKATPGILKMCGSQKLLDQLTECNKLLESVQKV